MMKPVKMKPQGKLNPASAKKIMAKANKIMGKGSTPAYS